jgi:hypothetical protein
MTETEKLSLSLRSLITGSVLCAYNPEHNELFEFLHEKDKNMRMTQHHLEAFGCNLIVDKGKGIIYITDKIKNNPLDELAEVGKLYEQMNFIELMLDKLGDDLLRPGAEFSLASLAEKINIDEQASELLIRLSNSNKKTEQTNLTRLRDLIKVILNSGYIAVTDTKSDRYVVTGKIQLFHERIQFLLENTMSSEEESVIDETGINGELF